MLRIREFPFCHVGNITDTAIIFIEVKGKVSGVTRSHAINETSIGHLMNSFNYTPNALSPASAPVLSPVIAQEE